MVNNCLSFSTDGMSPMDIMQLVPAVTLSVVVVVVVVVVVGVVVVVVLVVAVGERFEK